LRDFGETDQLAVFIPNELNDNIGPELAAVLADTPSFTGVFAMAGGSFECPLW